MIKINAPIHFCKCAIVTTVLAVLSSSPRIAFAGTIDSPDDEQIENQEDKSDTVQGESIEAPRGVWFGIPYGAPPLIRPETAEALAAREYEDRVGAGPIQFGGAMRVNYVLGSYDDSGSGGPTRGSHGGTFLFDTFRLNVDFDSDPFVGLLEYRWYESWNAPHTAWIGYNFSDESQLQAGLNRVPFGGGPYGAAHSWFFNLDYYVGLADDMDLGLKYTKPMGPTTIDVAYYPTSPPHWRGHSRRSARYSYDIVDEGITNGFNRERNQGNLRIIHRLGPEEMEVNVGASLQLGRLDNRGPGSNGWSRAAAIHLQAVRGSFGIKSQITAYHYDVDNAEEGGNDDIVIMGAYDAPYEVASRGTIPSLGISYTVEPTVHWIDSIMFYNDVSALLKSGRDDEGRSFRDSYQNVLGAAVTSGKWFNYFDFAIGRGAPFVGNRGDNFFSGLSSNQDAKWNYRFNINLGYYF